MNKIKDLEGSVPVTSDSDLTPITRQPIDKVNTTNWKDMSIAELWDQRSILEKRRISALGIGRGDIAQQIEKGIAAIDAVIRSRSSDVENTRLL